MLYISTNSRPDLAATLSILSQQVGKARDIDLIEIRRTIKYCVSTKHFKLKLSSEQSKLFGYSDSNFAGNRVDRKSNSGFIFYLNGGVIHWASRKQDSVSLSSTESEYISLSEAGKEAKYLRMLLNELGELQEEATLIYGDNQSALKMLHFEKTSVYTKHIDTRYHFIRELVQKEEIKAEFVGTDENIADILTKPLGASKIKYLTSKLNFEF